MNWLRSMRLCWARRPSDEALAAAVDAEARRLRACRDREEARQVRAAAEEVAATVRAHNKANRYDDFLRHVMTGGAG